MAVPVSAGTTFSPGEARRVFPAITGAFSSATVPYYDVGPNGSGFLMVRIAAGNQAPGGGQLVVVENWFAELEQKMRAARR
jgi:hypothetical protein